VRLSETGKRYRRFFATKEQAEKFIFETKRSGSVELAELAVEEKHILGVIRQSQKYEPKLLLEAWQRFEKEEIGDDRNLTVQELAEKFLARQKAQGRSRPDAHRRSVPTECSDQGYRSTSGGRRKTCRYPAIYGRDCSGNEPAKPLQDAKEAVALGARFGPCAERSDGETEAFG